MTDDDFTYDLISGDWLLGPDQEILTRVYEGLVTRSWSGGIDWIASRAVVEQIVADQSRLADEQKMFAPDSAEDAFGRFEWEGDVLLLHESDGETYRFEPLDADRNYEVGFGWCWYALDAEQDPPIHYAEVVRNDGTVEKKETVQ